MRRASVITLLIAIPLVALAVWVARNTYWEQVKVPMPPKGEALINPFYAVQRFADALGARTEWARVLTVPPANSIIVLSAWHWTLSTSRRQALERWVESGGRLVVDDSFTGGESEFAEWSGISRDFHEFDEYEKFEELYEGCRGFKEEAGGRPLEASETMSRQLCEFGIWSFLETKTQPEWLLRDDTGVQSARVTVGQGSVTVINATPFRERNLFQGDHGWLFVTATGMRRGDHVLFLSEEAHPSLLALMWQHGAPVVVLVLMLIGFLLWRDAIRFGPLAAATDPARRSLAEQIRGTGQFAVRHGHGEALHLACVRAMDEAAARRVPNYAQLSPPDRVTVLARLTGFDRNVLAAAVHQTGVRRSHNLRTTIALLESVRRHILVDTPRRARR